MSLDLAVIAAVTDRTWDADIMGALTDFIAIPNVSPAYDADWRAHGHMADAVELVASWCRSRSIEGMTVEVVELAERTPMVVIDIPATPAAAAARPDDVVLLYGHLDKQPEMTGWRADLGPWTPVVEGERLYGRGGADDGYAVFASLTAIEAVRAAGGEHVRCVVLIEASEESGSPDLPAHVEALAPRLGQPSLVVCLDSGCADYERLWITTSLRGLVGGTLTVRVLEQGMHSGQAGGIVASSFRIARQLLSRVEDESTGAVLLPAMHAAIPPDRVAEARLTASELPTAAIDPFPFEGGTQPISDEPIEQLLDGTWRPALAIVGADGLPPGDRAGNVLRPFTSLKVSMRVPPTVDAEAARRALVDALTADPPYGATVTFTDSDAASGWNAPAFAPWLADALQRASEATFGRPARMFGEGGTIPFMGMLGERFPAAQFVITGVIGPGANAHGPNEFLHLPTARRVTASVASILHDHATRSD